MSCPVSWGHSVPFLQLISAECSFPSSKLHQILSCRLVWSGNRGATLATSLYGQERDLPQESWTWNRNPRAPMQLGWGICSFFSTHWLMDHGWMGTTGASAQPGHAQWFPHWRMGGTLMGSQEKLPSSPWHPGEIAEHSKGEKSKIKFSSSRHCQGSQTSLQRKLLQGGESRSNQAVKVCLLLSGFKLQPSNLCFLWKLVECRTKWLNHKVPVAGCP